MASAGLSLGRHCAYDRAELKREGFRVFDSPYLRPGRFVESGDQEIVTFARAAAGGAVDPVEIAMRLYYAVRDGVQYDPYQDFGRPESYSAKVALSVGRGFCVPKAALLAAVARVMGLPSRLGFADVRNHLATPRLIEMNGGDVFYWHAYTDLFVDGRWVKATPAFNLELCRRFDVKPLEFGAREDSIFHPFDARDRRHMEYVADRGTYADVPYEEIVATVREHCPGLLRDNAAAQHDFAAEASSGG